MKILIFGKHGQVGSALAQLLADAELITLGKHELNLNDLAAIKRYIVAQNPDWLLNAAAYTAVDLAETHADEAKQINHLAPQAMAQACSEIDCLMLHYSTDYVFDGKQNKPYLESAKPNPQSVYGRTKLAGEQAVLAATPNAIILRTAWVYAQQGTNFMNTMLRLGQEKKCLNIVDDQYGSPTLASDLAQATVAIIKQTTPQNIHSVAGIYHATGAGSTTWFAFAKKIFALTQNQQIELTPVATAAYPTAAPRPAHAVLSNRKLKDTFGISLPHWETALAGLLG